jgi:hypothetical protein
LAVASFRSQTPMLFVANCLQMADKTCSKKFSDLGSRESAAGESFELTPCKVLFMGAYRSNDWDLSRRGTRAARGQKCATARRF